MKKLGRLIVLFMMIGILYLLIMILQPSTNAMIETTNSTANWSAHSNFGLAQGAMVYWPWFSYFVPVIIGVPIAVAIIKGED